MTLELKGDLFTFLESKKLSNCIVFSFSTNIKIEIIKKWWAYFRIYEEGVQLGEFMGERQDELIYPQQYRVVKPYFINFLSNTKSTLRFLFEEGDCVFITELPGEMVGKEEKLVTIISSKANTSVFKMFRTEDSPLRERCLIFLTIYMDSVESEPTDLVYVDDN